MKRFQKIKERLSYIFTPAEPLPLFELPVKRDGYRLLFMSDIHLNSFGGVGGYTDTERMEKMVEVIKGEYESERSFDAIILAGDVADTNIAMRTDPEINLHRTFKEKYISRLEDTGIPVFVQYGSHDATTEEDAYEIYGYSKSYCVRIGSTLFISLDTYDGEMRIERDGKQPKDIRSGLTKAILRYLSRPDIDEAFIVCHYPVCRENYLRILSHGKVRGVISGHSHYNTIEMQNGKPLLQDGHFSRAYTKMLTRGLGFSLFKPVPIEGNGRAIDEEGYEWADYSDTGSPWQFRVVERTAEGTESYIVYPEMTYKEFASDGIVFPAFTQPYAEARPSFLGESAPIDKSYIKF